MRMQTPKGKAHASLEVKRSKFLAFAESVHSSAEVRQKLNEMRSDYSDATHVVHAFVIGATGDIFGMSDDREPHGTAGRPVLEVLKGSGLTNILILVVRYFGGTKLGTGGLVKAYTEAAQRVLTLLPVEELVEKISFSLTFHYDLYDKIKKCLISHNAEIENESFEVNVSITGVIPVTRLKKTENEILTLSNGTVQFDRREQ